MSQNFNEKPQEPQLNLSQYAQKQPVQNLQICPKCDEPLCSNAKRSNFCPTCSTDYLSVATFKP